MDIYDLITSYAKNGIPFYDSLVYYAKPPHSYIGAAIFLSYIVLALYSTLSIVASLYTQYTRLYHGSNTAKDGEALRNAKSARARHIKIYTFLASVSFATLSYHMLFFLITHYFAYTGASDRDFSSISVAGLKKWMLDSTLFQDFAAELVKNEANAMWTQLAILATWFWNVWMARKAITRRFDPSMMQNFILLSQILPMSFTVCLFLIQLHLSSPDIQAPSSTSSKTSAAPVSRKPIASLHLPNILLNAALLALPPLQSHPIFSSLVVLARFILLLPHTGLISLRESDIDKSLFVGAGFIVASQMMGGKKGVKMGSEVKALYHGGSAVKALGWDAVLGAVVWLCLTWGGGV